ncbi:MAG: hypothetical protein QOC97_381, partial [Chloroflexota bacterium]|nr:hypothetical protein [Chloroflexota bacterium]
MTDRELEQQVRAWYVAGVGETEPAPADLRERVSAIPATTPTILRPRIRRRNFTLLAVAAVLVVGGVVAAGSAVMRRTPVATPPPNVAVVSPTALLATELPTPTANVRPGDSIAFIRTIQTKPVCPRYTSGCAASRVWIVGSDGRDAHALLPDGVTNQGDPAWSPDGTILLYAEEGKLYVTDAAGGHPRPEDTGCVTPCFGDSQVSFSNDGRSLVFARTAADASGYAGPTVVATMDLATGQVSELSSTGSDATAGPRWSPDGRHIVFYRLGEKDGGGPVPPRLSAVWVVDADGQNLHQVSPTTLAATNPAWSPDGARILFESGPLDGSVQDIYTVRPDGSDARRLTSDGMSMSASWTADGRILFVRRSSDAGDAGWWAMDADGTNATLLVSNKAIGVAASGLGSTRPAWRPLGGATMVPPPWTAAPGIAVGPPAPTPSPTPTPPLSPGFAWTGSASIDSGGPLGQTA